jgi:hypothetical protein
MLAVDRGPTAADAIEADVPDAFRLVPLGVRLLNSRLSACTCPPFAAIPTTVPVFTVILFDAIDADRPVAEPAEAESP